jgi:hypothetical protein
VTSAHSKSVFRRSALASAALFALLPGTVLAQEIERPTGVENTSGIVVRDDINLNGTAPTGALDNAVNITGVGQMIIDAGGGSVGLCTGTLINPRTVIFAAHCVNDQAANSYGSKGGGTAIGFGFEANNLPATRQWLGLDGGTLHATNEARAFYNVEHVWYDPRSLAFGPSLNFLQGDVAIATLDTPATDIPTWTLLFTPLSGETHGVVNGYGSRGNGTNGDNLGIDFRRRIAENMISALASLDNRDDFLFGPADPFFTAGLYQTDFDSPGFQGAFDFDLFDGDALPNEGTTAGGDSGGPLIADQAFDKQVVVGVLSGGSRFFNGQPFSSYGSSSFYQPLFLYWDKIVANNPYVYATNTGGNKNWSDPTNWVQMMDPNYAIEVDGDLVNALPGFEALGVAGGGPKFGRVCFLDDCIDLAAVSDPQDAGAPDSIYIVGGPGTRNFVPKNRVANPTHNVKPRYYDVTLAARGTTTVTNVNTIDRLNVVNGAELNLGKGGVLTVLGDFNQVGGITTFSSGLLVANEAFIASGSLSGSGTLRAPFVTVLGATVTPGGARTVGRFDVQGNLILTSATSTLFDIASTTADRIKVTAFNGVGGQISLGGTVAILPAISGGSPRFGQDYIVVTATGGVSGTFDRVIGGSAVLTPVITYGANDVKVRLNARSFASVATAPSASAVAFGNALDQLRYTNYAELSGLFGVVDYLDPAAISASLDGLAPRIVDEAAALQRDQTGLTLGIVADRLSMIGTSQATEGRFTLIGAPETLMALPGQTQITGSSAAQMSFAQTLAPGGRVVGKLPAGMSGFLAGGYSTQAGTSGSDRSGWHMAMGVEMAAGANTTIGTAFGFVNGRTTLTGSEAQADTSQAMAYGSYQLGGGAYLGGLASFSHTRIGVQRRSLGIDLGALGGEATASSYAVRAEAGVNLQPMRGVTLTPRMSVGYEGSSLKGYREQGSALGLLIDDLGDQRLLGRVGVKLAGKTTPALGWSFSPEARADFVSTIAGGSDTYDVRFAAAPELAFALPYASTDRSWGEVRGGFRMAKDKMSFGAGVESSVGRSDYRDDRAVVDFTLRF